MPPLIACVDDDVFIREALENLLLAFNFGVVCFDSAEALLASGNLDSISCLISDLKLGGKSGVELQRELQTMGYSIPTIIITAFASNALREAAVVGGIVDVLTKPITAKRLLSALTGALRDRE